LEGKKCRNVIFPYESGTAVSVCINKKRVEHVVDEHIVINKKNWIRIMNISKKYIYEYINNNKSNDFFEQVANLILKVVEWPASFPQYIKIIEEVSVGDKKYIRKTLNMITNTGILIIMSKAQNGYNITTAYYPIRISNNDTNYKIYERTISYMIRNASKQLIQDSKHGAERKRIQCKYFSDAHWAKVPSYTEYCERKL